MGNKIVMISAILAVMLMAGIGSAATQTITLGNTNTPQLNGIQVTVIYDDSGKISYQYVAGSAPVTNMPLGIDTVLYNSNDPTISASTADWSFNFGGTQGDSFGSFLSKKNLQNPVDNSGASGISSALVFTLENPLSPSPPTPNTQGGTSAVHVRFSNGCSGWVSDGTANQQTDNTACSSTTQIPEYPSVALPIASVIGLVFLFQYRKNKKE